jgi:hypothetical protein
MAPRMPTRGSLGGITRAFAQRAIATRPGLPNHLVGRHIVLIVPGDGSGFRGGLQRG